MILSDACVMLAKSARYYDDDPTTLRALRKSVTAIRRAAELEPESREVRHLLPIREKKLSDAKRELNAPER